MKRPALVWGSIGQVVLLIVVLVAMGRGRTETRSVKEVARPAKKHEVETVVTKHQVPIVSDAVELPVRRSYGMIGGKTAKCEARDAYLKIFDAEWALYPTDLVKKAGLKRIILCEDLSFAGQKRAAVPDFENNDLYLDVSRGSYNSTYVRKVLHHEFFHVIDWRDDGQLYEDDSWKQLNPKGFRYGRGGKTVQDDATVSLLNDRVPGFLNAYSQSGVEEDKAEIFANMVVAGDEVASRAAKDEIIQAKVTRMKELLRSFSSSMDEKFWDSARGLRKPKL